jgi:hypothetical protein
MTRLRCAASKSHISRMSPGIWRRRHCKYCERPILSDEYSESDDFLVTSSKNSVVTQGGPAVLFPSDGALDGPVPKFMSSSLLSMVEADPRPALSAFSLIHSDSPSVSPIIEERDTAARNQIPKGQRSAIESSGSPRQLSIPHGISSIRTHHLTGLF